MFDLIKNYIVIIVLVFCLCLGYVLKNIIKTDKINKYIPLIVGAVGILFNIWNNDWKVTPTVVVMGFLSGLASTGFYELFHNTIQGSGVYEKIIEFFTRKNE